jgi:hydrogenase/urease accessory protein HupE
MRFKAFLSMPCMFVLGCVSFLSHGHALDSGVLNLTQNEASLWQVHWLRPDQLGQPAALDVAFPEGCERFAHPKPAVFDGRSWTQSWWLDCKQPLAGQNIQILGLEATNTDVLVRFKPIGYTTGMMQRITADQPEFTLPLTMQPVEVLGHYLMLGVDHILEGWDHLAFVLCLLLLLGLSPALFWAVTSFTAAHSITLAAVSLELVRLPSAPVEAFIAWSVLFLAVEVAHHQDERGQQRPSLAKSKPWLVTFSFGLLHGFGFAGALGEIGLPANEIPLALLGFNLGVELGQMAFIAAAGTLGWFLAHTLNDKFKLSLKALTFALGSVASYWTLSRLVVIVF